MKRADIAVSAAAGLAVVFPLYQLLLLPEMCESPKLTPGEAAALTAALASYLSVPLLPGPLRSQRATRFAWLWTPLMGSMLAAVALYSLVSLKEWGPAQFAIVWFALCVWTLPFAAVVNYSGTIVRVLRRRHKGPKED